MSLLPFFEDFVRPSRLLDQHFGSVLDDDDLFAPMFTPRDIRSVMRNHFGYLRPWRSAASHKDIGSTISVDDAKFQANLDVQQFAPNELNVKVTGENTVTIEAKHEEIQDEHGFISRQFVRKYVLPKDCDMSRIESRLSSDGVLSITAPRAGTQNSHRAIPITQTGQPSRPDDNKKGAGESEAQKK